MLTKLPPLKRVDELETRAVLKKLASARATLAELKGVSGTIPNEQIIIDTLSLQEAKDSSAIENIVTTQDELYQSDYDQQTFTNAAAKEVHRYAEALKTGFAEVRKSGIIRIGLLNRVKAAIEGNDAGIRKVPGPHATLQTANSYQTAQIIQPGSTEQSFQASLYQNSLA